MKSDQLVRTNRMLFLRPLTMVDEMTLRRRYLPDLNSISSIVMQPHAGGPDYKGTAAAAVSVDGTIESTGTDGATVAASSDDDDGDGDGDPDSDRTPHTQQKPRNTPKRREAHQKEKTMEPHNPQKSCYTATLQTALDRKRVTTSNRILRMAELKNRISLSRSTIYEAQKKGEFPSSISLGARAVGWLESDIDAWLESRVNASKAA